MTQKLTEALKNQKKSTPRNQLQIVGTLGISLGGQRLTEVPGRKSFVYVKLRDNQNEVIQAFNNKVAASYGLPVVVERRHGRYMVLDVDTIRYQNNWNSNAPFLPRHGNTHSFDPDNSGGGDIVWVHSRQFMPSLIIPSGSSGGPNVVMASYTIRNPDGTWKYVGNTGTSNITSYKPSMPTGAVMALVYLDSVSGNPYFIVGSGSYFPASITGTAQVVPYIPTLPNFSDVPLAAIRLVTGTSTIGWDNIYDLRQFLHTPTGTAGGSSLLTIWDEGIPQGTASILNFVGNNVDVSVSGTVARVFVTGSTGGGVSNLTGTAIGEDFRLVGTNSLGYLIALRSIAWQPVGISSEFLKFGINLGGQEGNAGVVGYQVFDSYFDIIGAGTSAGNRTVKVYDNLIVSSNMNAGSYTLPGVVSQLISTDGSGNFQGSENYAPSGTYGRRDKGWVSVIPEDGWLFVSENWTRTGNHAFAIVGQGDLSNKYRKGTKVKYNDPSLDFGVIGAVAVTGSNTYITLIENDDYAMASGFISGRYISYIENPEGFPDWFNWTPTVSAGGSMTVSNTSIIGAHWKVKGQTLQYEAEWEADLGGTAHQDFRISYPTVLPIGDSVAKAVVAGARDAASGLIPVGTGANTATHIAARKADVTVWTLAVDRRAIVCGSYQF